MELKEDFITQNGFTPEQVTALTTATNEHEATLKQGWDGLANENAEKIIDGALKSTEELTGIKRETGEKSAVALQRINGLYFEGTKTALERQKTELTEKIKNSGGDDDLKQELADNRVKLDLLQQKEAKFSDWEENDYKGLWEQASTELNNQQKDIAFNSVKPNFPTTANEYEVKGKWNEFISKTLETKKIEKDSSGDWVAVDKENKHLITPLSDLVKANNVLTELQTGRQQTGTGANKSTVKVEGVPFNVPENATSTERQQAIRDYLASQNISQTSAEYSKQFSALNTKLQSKKTV